MNSREVDLSHLKGFRFRSVGAKNEEWRDLQLVSQITFEWRKLSVTIKRVCVSKSSKEQIVYSVLKWLQTKILEEN